MSEARKMDFADEGIRTLLQGLAPGDRVGIVGFDNKTYPERQLTNWKRGDSLDTELSHLMPAGGTDINLGLQAGMKMLLDAPPVADAGVAQSRVKRLLLITDGMTNAGVTELNAIEDGLKPGFNSGVRLSCIGVGVTSNDALLSRLCRIPGNNGRFVDKPSEIKKSMQELFNAMLPLEIDKPQVTLTLPPNVRVTHGYGTEFKQDRETVTFPKLTSIGSDDYEIVCLQLKGSIEALKAVAGASVSLTAFSPVLQGNVQLDAAIEDVSALDGAAMDSPRKHLATAFAKAEAVAFAAEAMKSASHWAEAKNWKAAAAQMADAQQALDVFGKNPADGQIAEINQLIRLNNDVLNAKMNPPPTQPQQP